MPADQVKIKKQSESTVTGGSSGSEYPWGTGLHFHGDLVEEMGLENVAAGDIVEIRGFAFVESKSEHSSIDDSDKSVRVQFTSMKIQRTDDDRAEQLYGPNS